MATRSTAKSQIELAAWYREFAERAANPVMWEARIRSAKILDEEADRQENAQNRYELKRWPLRPEKRTKGLLCAVSITLLGLMAAPAPAAPAVWSAGMAHDIAAMTAERADAPLVLVRRGGGGGFRGGGGGGFRGGGGAYSRGGGGYSRGGGYNRGGYNRANIGGGSNWAGVSGGGRPTHPIAGAPSRPGGGNWNGNWGGGGYYGPGWGGVAAGVAAGAVVGAAASAYPYYSSYPYYPYDYYQNYTSTEATCPAGYVLYNGACYPAQ